MSTFTAILKSEQNTMLTIRNEDRNMGMTMFASAISVTAYPDETEERFAATIEIVNVMNTTKEGTWGEWLLYEE